MNEIESLLSRSGQKSVESFSVDDVKEYLVNAKGEKADVARRLQTLWQTLYDNADSERLYALIGKLLSWGDGIQQLGGVVDANAVHDSVVYCMYVHLWAGGDAQFRDATQRLAYLCELGINCIWILPCLESPMLDAGFDISDFHSVRASLGDNDAFRAFLDAAHRLGIAVLFDLALNHCSSQHPWFVSAVNDESSPTRDYFVWSDDASEYAQTRIIFADVETSNWTKIGSQYYFHRFYAHQPDLNYK
jgi:maltose alpha-D-glucosyltransferase/alpha-amylase